MNPSGNWIAQFPGLRQLPDDLFHRISTHSQLIALPAGSRIYGPGQAPQSYLLLLDGAIRVQQVSETGREIVLYRVSAGESCALTTACLMGYEDYPAEAIAETGVKAVAIPRATFDDMVARSPDFRRFVFTAFSARVTDLCRIIDAVAFARMDIRLAQKLLELAHGGDTLAITQQQLASELGTAREVISRLLTEFQRRGWITQVRGNITIADRSSLDGLAHDHASRA
jgi:CRP/FNR family transcriptional regulator, anaerobic regulatory protein